jgi:senataxin
MADAPRDPAHHDPMGLETMKTFGSQGNQSGDAFDPQKRSKNVRGIEANFALKLANNPAKRSKLDEHKEAMLGKKRARQTVIINDEDAKQAGTGTISTPRRQSRGVGEGTAETQSQLVIRDQRQAERMGSEQSNSAAPDDQNTESHGDFELASQDWSKKMNGEEPPSDGYEQSVPRHLRQTMDSKQFKGRPVSSQRAVVTGQNTADQKPANKRSLVSKKQASANNTQYNDTSIERLLQEVTSDKFWHNPGCSPTFSLFLLNFLNLPNMVTPLINLENYIPCHENISYRSLHCVPYSRLFYFAKS